jgi:hypothetical protein
MTVTVASTLGSRSAGVVNDVPDATRIVLVTIDHFLYWRRVRWVGIREIVDDLVVYPSNRANEVIYVYEKTAVRGNVAGGISHDDIDNYISFCADNCCAQNLNPR